jgi:hypothetical protein
MNDVNETEATNCICNKSVVLRRDDRACGVDLLAALGRDVPDLNDAVALNGDVGAYRRAALTIEHQNRRE